MVTAILVIGCPGCRSDPTAVTGGTFKQLWYQLQFGYGQARPAILQESVVFATGDGALIARTQATGAVLWNNRIAQEQISGANLLARSGVVVAPIAYTTAAVDAATGATLWSYAAPVDSLNTSVRPAAPGYVVGARLDADEQTVFVPAWGATVSALDLRSGQLHWVWHDSTSVLRSGAVGVRVSGDTLFATLWRFLDTQGLRSEAVIVAIDRATGRELWELALPSHSGGVITNGAAALSGNLVIIGIRGGDVWAIDRDSHAIAWHYAAKSLTATIAEPEVVDSMVYIDGGDGNVYALRANDGSIIWRAEFQGLAIADLLVTPRAVYVANGPTFSAFDRLTGRLLARSDAPHSGGRITVVGSPAAAAAGRVFLTVSDGAWGVQEP